MQLEQWQEEVVRRAAEDKDVRARLADATNSLRVVDAQLAALEGELDSANGRLAEVMSEAESGDKRLRDLEVSTPFGSHWQPC